LRELVSSDLGLQSSSECLDCKDTGSEFVFAEDDDVAGDAVSGLEGFLEAEGAVADFDGEAGSAEFAGEGESGGVAFGAEWGDVGVKFGRFEVQGSRFEVLCGGLGLEGEDEAVFADGEADAGSFGAAEHLGEAVVAAAAEEGVLRAEAAGWSAEVGTVNSKVVRV
jgi:hypothetical protein